MCHDLNTLNNMSIGQLLNCLNGYVKKKNEDMEYLKRISFESARLISFFSVNTQLKKPLKSPEKLIRFKWDVKKRVNKKNKLSELNKYPDKISVK